MSETNQAPLNRDLAATRLVESLMKELRVARYEGARHALLELATVVEDNKGDTFDWWTPRMASGDEILRYANKLYPALPAVPLSTSQESTNGA